MSELESAASVLAQARAETAKAADALDRAQAEQGRVRERVDALGAERAGIVAASRSGNQDPRRALRLAVIEADLADLAPMVAKADAKLAKAQCATAAARQAVIIAEQQLERAKDEVLLTWLVVHATHRDGFLLATLSEIAAIDRKTGRRPSWAPSRETYDALSRLHLTAAGLRR